MTEKRVALRSGELAKLAGVSTDTLRHYERMGIVPRPTRTAAGYRSYPREALERVLTVRNALQLGFTLRELAEVFAVRDGGGAPCAGVLAMTERKLAELDERIRQLQGARRSMHALVRDWREQLAQKGAGEKAHLLQSLNGRPKLPQPAVPALTRRVRP